MAAKQAPVNLFTSEGDGNDLAYLVPNKATPRTSYVLGYFDAAKRLADLILTRRAPIDIAIYPVVYLYRHAVELALKELHEDFARILKTSEEPLHGHKLLKLWQKVEPNLGLLDPVDVGRTCYELEMDAPDVARVAALIGQLARVDPDGQAARYERDNKGNETLNSLDVINVRVFAVGMEEVCQALHAWMTFTSAYPAAP